MHIYSSISQSVVSKRARFIFGRWLRPPPAGFNDIYDLQCEGMTLNKRGLSIVQFCPSWAVRDLKSQCAIIDVSSPDASDYVSELIHFWMLHLVQKHLEINWKSPVCCNFMVEVVV